MDNGDILNKYLWEVCPFKVASYLSAALGYLQAKKNWLLKYNAIHCTCWGTRRDASKCSQVVSEVRRFQSW